MILQTSCFHAQDILHRTRSGHLIGQLLERLVYSSLFILQSSLFMFHITSMLFQLYLKGQTLFKKGKRVLEFQYGILVIVVLAINGRACSRSGISLLIPTVGIPLACICYLFYVILYTGYSLFAYSRFKSRQNATFWSKVGETGVGETGVGDRYQFLYTSMICMIMHMVVLMNAFTKYLS